MWSLCLQGVASWQGQKHVQELDRKDFPSVQSWGLQCMKAPSSFLLIGKLNLHFKLPQSHIYTLQTRCCIAMKSMLKTGSVDPSRRSHLSKPSHKPNGGGVAGRKHVKDCSHPLAPAAQAADWLTFPDGRLQGLHHAAPLLASIKWNGRSRRQADYCWESSTTTGILKCWKQTTMLNVRVRRISESGGAST